MLWLAVAVCLGGIVTIAVGDLRENLNLMVLGGIVACSGFLYVVLGALP